MPAEFEHADWFSNETATLGDRLEAARDAAGLLPAEFATRLGVDAKVVSDWENDAKEPRGNRIVMIAGMLNVSVAWLLTGVNEGAAVQTNDPSDIATAELTGILDEMQQLRAKMACNFAELATLEKRLRAALKATT